MPAPRPDPHPNRESWLNDVASRLRPAFAQLGAPLPDRLRIAIGFSSTGRRAKATGECWDSAASADATFEILVRPDLAEAEGALGLPVAAALARELVHAAVGIQAGRGPAYRKVAHSIGLVGPMRATSPGPAFLALIAPPSSPRPHRPALIAPPSSPRPHRPRPRRRRTPAPCPPRGRLGGRSSSPGRWGGSDHYRSPQAGQPACQMHLPHLRLRRPHRTQVARPGRAASLPPAWVDAGGGSRARAARVASGGDPVTPVPGEERSFLSSSLFDPPEAGRWCGAFLAPTPSGGCGAQRRARAAPLGAGTGPARSHAQPPLGGEHGEHGEDPPLARSEHRGTQAAWAGKLSTGSRALAGLGLLLDLDF